VKQLKDVMDLIQRDPAMRRSYEQYEKAASDRTSEINGAKREGAQTRSWEIARNLKTMGFSPSQIVQATGLESSDVQKL
jgi:predicted transposase/invertase (TIGR01784 family)